VALITVAAEIGAEIDPSRIVFGVMGMQSEKVAVETLAQPIAHFGLYEPVFQPGVAELPGVVIARHVERDPAAERRLDAQIDRGRSIVEQVALDGPSLGARRMHRCQQDCQHEIEFIHFPIFYCPENDRTNDDPFRCPP